MKQQLCRQLTFQPLRAIRERCLWCSNDQPKEIEACAAKNCSLHPFRMGSETASDKVYLTAIRKVCLDCQTGSYVEVERCMSTGCPLWGFREKRMGIRAVRGSVTEIKDMADKGK